MRGNGVEAVEICWPGSIPESSIDSLSPSTQPTSSIWCSTGTTLSLTGQASDRREKMIVGGHR